LGALRRLMLSLSSGFIWPWQAADAVLRKEFSAIERESWVELLAAVSRCRDVRADDIHVGPIAGAACAA